MERQNGCRAEAAMLGRRSGEQGSSDAWGLIS